MTPQMMSLHHQTQTSILPEIAQDTSTVLFLDFSCTMQHSVHCTPRVYNVYMGHPQYSILPLSKATFTA